MKPLVLFDIDGTLLLTGGAGLRAMVRAARELFGASFSFDGVTLSGGMDPRLLDEAAERCGFRLGPPEHLAFRERYLARLEEELEAGKAKVRAMPGVPELLGLLRDGRKATLGLLTGNYEVSASMKLAAAGLAREWFEVGAFGDEAPSRPELVGVALEKYRERYPRQGAPERTVIVGDTPRDVHCARATGCRALAVATGQYTVEDLIAAGASAAVKDLSDAAPLFRLLEPDGAPFVPGGR